MDFIPMAQPYIGDEEADAVYRQIKSKWISMGKRVEEFEALVADYIGVDHVVAFSNGTATLHASLLAVGVTKGDEVLVPTLSYISSANAVLFCGAKPVFVEEDPKTFNVNAEGFKKKITSRTKAIMPVDLKGMSVDYDSINELANSYGIPVVADSAEALGAKYKNKLVGSQSIIHSFSMFANKNITTGEGGFITTNDSKLADVCRCIRNQGQSERYVHIMIGHNYRLTDIAAAFGIEQLKRVEYIMDEKNKIADHYNNAFASHKLITTPYIPEYATRHSWYMYCLALDENVDRNQVIRLMKEDGVDSRLSFPPIPLQPIYREMFGYKDGDFSCSEKIFKSFLDIPGWVGMTKDQMQRVIDVVIASVEKSI